MRLLVQVETKEVIANLPAITAVDGAWLPTMLIQSRWSEPDRTCFAAVPQRTRKCPHR